MLDIENPPQMDTAAVNDMNKKKRRLAPEDVPFTKSWLSFEFGIYCTILFTGYCSLMYSMYKMSAYWASSLPLQNTWLGPSDLNDYQWRSFRETLPSVSLLAIIHIGCSRWLFPQTGRSRAWGQLIFGVLFNIYLHRSQFFYFLALLSFFYFVVRSLLSLLADPLLGQQRKTVVSNSIQAFAWLFGLAVMYQSQFNPSLFFLSNWLGPDYDIYDAQQHNWPMVWNFMMLKLISFAMDWTWMRTDASAPARISPTHQTYCDVCDEEGRVCEQRRARTNQPATRYSLLNFLAYAFYTPLYIAGPIITFNSFVSQLHLPQQSHSNRQQLFYFIRWAVCLLVMELMTRFFYLWALRDQKIFSTTVNTNELCIAAYFSLVLLWVKFTVIWRFFRCWSLLAGVEPPENMRRCVNNNYTMQGFWRGWHASFNAWLVRYLYVPLGGSKYKFLNVWVVFLFVAVWHEVEPRLLYWAVFVGLVLLPELTIGVIMRSKTVTQSAIWKRWCDSWVYRAVCAVFATASILLMMFVNLVGFFVGRAGVQRILMSMLFDTQSLPFVISICIGLWSTAMIMFKIRVNEKVQQIKNA